uniref:RNA polymerase II-associated protein 3 n=1 Tax=Trichuris muris TaxID=70415 RepID=A0A5S6Q2Z6_TRIMR
MGKRVFMKRALPELTLKADGGVNFQVLSEFVRVDDIYTFQNIGFSRKAGDVKYLLCADCEIGPLGKSMQLNTEMANSRDKQQPSCVNLEKCASERQQGNIQYGKKQYVKAVMHYSRAIEANMSDPVPYCNRAMALLKLARYEEASKDCCAAISLDNGYVKAYFRRGLASKELGRIKEAEEDFRSVLALEPDNHLAKEEIEKLYASSGKEFDEPLRQIPIRWAPVAQSSSQPVKQSAPAEAPKAADEQLPTVDDVPVEVCPVPSSVKQLLVDWKTLRGNSESLCNYVLNIPLPKFQEMFDNFLSTAELSDLLKAFPKVLNDDVKLHDCVKRLLALTASRRFGSATVFLTKTDKENLKIILNRASTSEKLKDDCCLLWKRFRMEHNCSLVHRLQSWTPNLLFRISTVDSPLSRVLLAGTNCSDRGDGHQRSIFRVFPECVVEMRRHRWRTLRIRYSSGSSGSINAQYGGSGGGGRSSKQWRSQHQCCCCCCSCHHGHQSTGILNAGTLFMKKDSKRMLPKSDACVTILLWLLLVLQFVVNCIRFFSTQYNLTSVAEKNSLFALLNNHCGQSRKTRRRRRSKASRTEKAARIADLTEPSDDNTSGVQSTLSSAYVSPVPAPNEDYKLGPLYTSTGSAKVGETNFITCIFEATGSKVLEVVDDLSKELDYWGHQRNLVTICCEMTWSVPSSERHVPSELSIQQAVLKHMEKNQRRVDAMTMALYNAKGWLKSLPNRPFAPVVQQNCHSRNGATLGCYRRVYPGLLSLAHKDASDAHQPFWALRITDMPLVPAPGKGPQVSMFTINLICVTLESSDGFYV